MSFTNDKGVIWMLETHSIIYSGSYTTHQAICFRSNLKEILIHIACYRPLSRFIGGRKLDVDLFIKVYILFIYMPNGS